MQKRNETFAIIATGGKQYLVRPGGRIVVEKLTGEEGKPVTFSDVLLLVKDGAVRVGEPQLADARVTGTLMKTAKGKKVRVVKYKSKTRQHKATGHRQVRSTVRIDEIR
jgi:large subunit ribosomal protein L21